MRKIFIAVLFILLSIDGGYPQGARGLFYQGVRLSRSGRVDFAFMNFDRLLREFPRSKYSEDALFSVGEYYFIIKDYRQAKDNFIKFISLYPESKTRLFAFAYLIKIAERGFKEDAILNYEKEIVTSEQTSLIFRDSKEVVYSSGLSRSHKAVYFIDKVEIYIDDESFTSIPF